DDFVLKDNLGVEGSLLLQSGVLDPSTNSKSITIGGNWKVTGGTFSTGTQSVTFNSARSTDQDITTNGQSFYNITFRNSPNTSSSTKFVLKDNLPVNGMLAVYGGTLDLDTNDKIVRIGGSFIIGSAGDFSPGTSSVIFNS